MKNGSKQKCYCFCSVYMEAEYGDGGFNRDREDGVCVGGGGWWPVSKLESCAQQRHKMVIYFDDRWKVGL